jgi:chitin biosynthesis protein CHS5
MISLIKSRRMVPISAFYLGTTQSSPMNSPPFTRPQSMSQASLPQSAQAAKAANRASMPAPSRTPTSPGPTPPIRSDSPSKAVRRTFEATPEEGGDGDESQDVASQMKPTRSRGPPRVRHGTMDREFKFPVATASPELDAALHGQQAAGTDTRDTRTLDDAEEAGWTAVDVVAPSSSTVEVPPPPPIEKERSPTSHDDGDEDVGETEEISLN